MAAGPEIQTNDAPDPTPVTIVVPVYGALGALERCVRSAVAHTDAEPSWRMLLFDDGSPDQRAAQRVLADLASLDPRIDVRSRVNRGYTATINEACRSVSGDVVLLNSDTEVPPGWLARLHGAATSRDDVATVTPVSNAAGAFSVPEPGVNADLPEGTDVTAVDELVRALSDRRLPEAPTGNGYCMYVTRRAFDEAGFFDELAFPRGYCEENDFCRRATAVGLVHLVDDGTFVRHTRSASFGASKDEIMLASRRQLDELHPSYTRRIRSWLVDHPLRQLGADLAVAMERDPEERRTLVERPRPRVLFVLHAGAGGTPQTNADLMAALTPDYACLLLRCGVTAWTLETVVGSVVRRWVFEEPWNAREPLDADRRAALLEVVEDEAVDVVHARSLLALAPEALEAVKATGVHLVVSFHDFYVVCPTIQLLDHRWDYCAGHCTAGQGTCKLALGWFGRSWPDLKHRYVHDWRARMAEGLRHADAFVTTSESAAEVIVDHFPFVRPRLRIIEHGRDLSTYAHAVRRPAPGEPHRVVAFGALGYQKGIALIEALMKLDIARGPRFEFHFAGVLHGGWDPTRWGGIVHGAYERDALAGALDAIGPSSSLIPSLWPETYCHTLTESWACGVPAFASELGALGERIRREGGGWLFDPGDPVGCYERMAAVADDVSEWDRRADEVSRIDFGTTSTMAAAYADVYRLLRSPESAAA